VNGMNLALPPEYINWLVGVDRRTRSS